MFTEAELKKIIGLAKLYVDDAGLPELARGLESAVAFAGQIAGAEVDAAEDEAGSPLSALREDVAAPSLSRELILANARKAENGFFVAGGGGK